MRTLGRAVLVATTIVFLLSMGGGMLYVWWLLVPLHWLAARDAGPTATVGWSLLAASSLGEVAWMTAYAADAEATATIVGVAVAVATVAGFLAARLRRIPVS